MDYLVREIFAPINASLDYIFAAGVLYGAKHLAGFAWSCLKGIRTYFVPFGRSIRRDLTVEFGKWAGTHAAPPTRGNCWSHTLLHVTKLSLFIVITGATSGIGLAFAHEVSVYFHQILFSAAVHVFGYPGSVCAIYMHFYVT